MSAVVSYIARKYFNVGKYLRIVHKFLVPRVALRVCLYKWGLQVCRQFMCKFMCKSMWRGRWPGLALVARIIMCCAGRGGAGRGAGVWAWSLMLPWDHTREIGQNWSQHRDNEATETFVAAKLSSSKSQDWRTLLHILMANQHYINTVIWAMLQ